MNYGSVCSGMEAATCAWHPLGWTPAFVSEIDPTASRLLAGLYPDVPNLGDMTKFQEWPDYAIDLLVGGTPCQSFSVAGLRKGMADPRGNLALTYLAIADRYKPHWIVWENVPGVLSSWTGDEPPSDLAPGQRWESTETSDFGCFLAGLSELGYGWAYRVLDAQFVRVQSHPGAVPQRRRRVFVVGHLGDWRRAAAVLFERESMSGHPPPRRQARKTITGGFETGPGGGSLTDLAPTLDTRAKGSSGPAEDEVANLVAHTLKAEGFDASEDGTGRGTPIVPVVYPQPTTGTLSANGGSAKKHGYGMGQQDYESGYAVPVAYRTAGDGAAYEEGDATAPLTTGTDQSAQIIAQAYDMRGREGGAQFEGPHDTANIRAANGGSSSRSYVAENWAVRRLTPTECLRLQGFPDDYFDRARLNKPLADGPKYKMLGNSMAVNVMSWIGQRIQLVEGIKP